MKQYLTSDDVFAELLMIRTRFHGTLLVLEGPDDCRLLDQFVNSTECKTIPGHGKTRVLEVIKKADKNRLKGVLAIVDADFWHLEGQSLPSSNVLMTDVHDMEMMLLGSPALERVVTNYGSRTKIEKYLESSSARDLLTAILVSSLPIGLLRWISHRKGLYLKFDGVEVERYIDRVTLTVDIDRLVSRVLQNTGNRALKPEEISRELANELKVRQRITQVCSGHDAIRLLGVGLRRVLGSCRAHIAAARNLEAMLRMAYQSDHFSATSLYARIKEWERSNRPYLVVS